MNQLAIEFAPRHVRVPDPETQCGVLLQAFKKGERLTTGEAFSKYGITTISQRCGELRSAGWPVKSEMTQVGPRTWVKRYWMDA